MITHSTVTFVSQRTAQSGRMRSQVLSSKPGAAAIGKQFNANNQGSVVGYSAGQDKLRHDKLSLLQEFEGGG